LERLLRNPEVPGPPVRPRFAVEAVAGEGHKPANLNRALVAFCAAASALAVADGRSPQTEPATSDALAAAQAD
jgi:hypothetical protein